MLLALCGIFGNLFGVSGKCQGILFWWLGENPVICLEQGADDLHVVQLMSLPPLHLFSSLKSRIVLPFWYWFTQVGLEKRLLNRRVLLGVNVYCPFAS